MYVKNCTIILLLLATLHSSAEIYRCHSESGEWLFTDGPCDKTIGQAVELAPLETLGRLQPANLNPAESRALGDLDKRMTESRHARSKRQKRISGRIRKERAIQQQRCDIALRDIAKVRDKRRHGYKVSEARALDLQASNLHKKARADCIF